MTEIVLVLARGPGRPDGDLADRLELSVSLSALAYLDEAGTPPPPWPALRTLPDGRIRVNELIRVDAGWALRGAAGEDAPLWDVLGTVFRPGEYVTLRRPDGEELIFRVVDVHD